VQAAPMRVSPKNSNALAVVTEQLFNGSRGTVAEMQANDFWRMAKEKAPVTEIRIFGDNNEAIVLGVLPNYGVVCFVQVEREQVARAGKQIGQPPDELRRQVVIEEELHARGLRRLLKGCRVGQAGLNIFARQVREIVEYLLDGHAGGQVLKDILNGYSHATNTRLAASLARLQRNVLSIIEFHALNIQKKGRGVKPSTRLIKQPKPVAGLLFQMTKTGAAERKESQNHGRTVA
jgi:hypothetical protein